MTFSQFDELINISMKEKRGLTFFVAGQTIGGMVVRRHDDGALELSNQQYRRIVLRLDRVDAVALI
jgi:hypothetical protein